MHTYTYFTLNIIECKGKAFSLLVPKKDLNDHDDA